MSDPVAEKSGFLRMYMSNHPDTLVAYAKWFGKVKEVITGAEMTAIDCKSMTLTCTLKSGSKKEVIVPIEPPLSGYEDVKPRLLEMKAFAQEGLGMIKAPKISTFEIPRDGVIMSIISVIGLYLWLLPGHPSAFGRMASSIVSYTGAATPIKYFNLFIVIAHSFESLYMASLCRRHSTGFGLGALYVASTFFGGFPTWVALRKRIQAARIDSVMKIQ